MNITTEANLAAQWILNEKVIAYPTEGVWGIGGLNTSENIKAINLAKQRDETKNYILLFYSFQQQDPTTNQERQRRDKWRWGGFRIHRFDPTFRI